MAAQRWRQAAVETRSEEHTSELQPCNLTSFPTRRSSDLGFEGAGGEDFFIEVYAEAGGFGEGEVAVFGDLRIAFLQLGAPGFIGSDVLQDQEVRDGGAEVEAGGRRDEIGRAHV